MDEKDQDNMIFHGTDREQGHVRDSSAEPRSKTREALRLGALTVVACVIFGIGARWICRTSQYNKVLPAVPDTIKLEIPSADIAASPFAFVHLNQPSPIALPAKAIERRDNHDVEVSTYSNGDVAVTTNSEGTWIIATAAATTESPSSHAALTTTETESLTDHIIISFTTVSKISTVTVTSIAKGSTSSTSNSDPTTTSSSSTSPSTFTPTQSPSPTPPATLTPIPTPAAISSCPYLTCASTCPWTTCTLSPKTMDTNLCQMLDPCFFDQKGGNLPKPPSQGGKCACLCESGYCANEKLGCAQWDCCHECQCFEGNPMAKQSGRGNC